MLDLASSSMSCGCGPEAVRAEPELVCVSIRAVAALVEDAALGGSRLEHWLTAAELRTYLAFAVPKRRLDWLAGRLAAKEAVRAKAPAGRSVSFGDIEIYASASAIDGGRPRYTQHGQEGSCGLSICHSGDTAAAALSSRCGDEIGLDIECVSPRGTSFERVALSQHELEQLRDLKGAARDRAVTLVWVMKESLLKALGIGLRMPLPQLRVHLEALDGYTAGHFGDIGSATVTAPGGEPIFSIDSRAAHLHPLLPQLGHLPMTVSTFSLGDALGCLVTLLREEEPWKR